MEKLAEFDSETLKNVSPMMQHYLQTKEQYPDCILFYRLGDFYEMFFDDAVFVSKTLKLTLTGKSCGLPERAPMCGVPFHAADTYIDRLVAEGCKVAVCEQLEDPKDAKGIVKRDVIRVVTPGTNTNIYDMDSGSNSYIMCIAYICDCFGIATSDVTTGDLLVTQIGKGTALVDEISKFAPKEIICNQSFFMSGIDIRALKERFNVPVNSLKDQAFDETAARNMLLKHFGVASTAGLGLDDALQGLVAAGALLSYLTDTQKCDPKNITDINVYNGESFMTIDSSSRRNLELTETMREKEKRGSLFWVIDKTKTAMGSRMLKSFLAQPLIDVKAIEERLDAVSELSEKLMDRDEIREYLGAVYDIERLMCRVSYGNANPRDIIALKNSLSMLGPVKKVLSGFECSLLKSLNERMDDFEELLSLTESAIVDEPPLAMKEGGIIKPGYNEEADRLRTAKTEGKNWLLQLENEQREKTGIKNLRIRFNKVFGYYFEVTNSFLNLVPENYIRKQTLTNAERFTTDELKKIEDTILNSEERLCSLEYELFDDIRKRIAGEVSRIRESAKAVSLLDAFCSLSYVAEHEGYVRPSINSRGIINIKDGRHPVVEKMIPAGSFVSNDVYLDNENNRILIITGPNMAGKSTYMRFTALIVLMAAIGSFVPAKSADVCVTDRIFTRVGASDDLASGQSTFMVEMTEVANILRNATKNSLLILDEIGRGTSTYDGLAIAWAVVEHISNVKLCGGKALFATHYHELTTLEGKIPCVNNYCFAVKERGDDVVFLRKITRGGADRSYGIEVAKLAGVPASVIERAKVIVDELSDNDLTEKIGKPKFRIDNRTEKRKGFELENQMTLFDYMGYDVVIDEIKKLDLSNMTPMEAMNTLYKLQSEVIERNEKKDPSA